MVFPPPSSSAIIALITIVLVSHVNADDSEATCTGSNVRFWNPSQNRCIDWWERGNDYKYPDDFREILNKVDIYVCPTSQKRIVVANGIPDHDVTLRNNNPPCEFNRAIVMPLNPTVSGSPYDIPVRGIIAVGLNGVPAFGPQEVSGSNAMDPDGPVSDAGFWYGHGSQQNAWHFHSPHMGQEVISSEVLLGYAMDGFPIYGPLDASAPFDGLDDCNGRYVNGKYRYHVIEYTHIDEDSDYCVEEGVKPEVNWRYIVGCYSGTPHETSVEDSTTYDKPSDCYIEGSPTAAPTPTPDNNGPNIIIMQPDDMKFFDAWSPPPNNPNNPDYTVNLPPDGLPNLDTLRQNGLHMKQAYTASPACGTSRFSTMTGRYPSRSATSRKLNGGEDISDVTIPTTKLTNKDGQNDCTEDNMAATLKSNGYRTGMVGKWHLTRFGDDYTYTSAQTTIKECGFDFVDGLYIENMNNDGIFHDDNFSHNMEWITSEAIKFINDDTTYGDKPFFMYFNPTVPHSSMSVVDALDSSKYPCTATANGFLDSDPIIKGMTEEFGSCEAYRANVSSRAGVDADLGNLWVDDSVGALLQALTDKGVLDNTIFLFQQDHGMETKTALYENGVRVVQFVHYPNGIAGGQSFDGAVSTIDIAPTMFDFAGVNPPYELDGVSWKDQITVPSSIFAPPKVEVPWSDGRCLLFEMDQDRAVRCGCFKYLEIFDSTSGTYTNGANTLSSNDPTNLFDLCNASDSYETDPTKNQEADDKNLVSTNPTMTATMLQVLNCYKGKTDPDETSDYTTVCEAPTTSPVASPTATPTTSAPVTTPTKAPTTGCSENGTDKYLLKINKGKAVTRTCNNLSKRKNKNALCKNKVAYKGKFSPPQITCQATCNSCDECYENNKSKFFRKKNKKGKSLYKNCNWLKKLKNETVRANICARNKTDNLYPGAADACPKTCGVGSC